MRPVILITLLAVFQTASGAIDVENPLCDSFTLEGYLDLRYCENGSYNAVPSREFLLRRAGIEIKAQLTDGLAAELKPEFRTDEMFLKDALIQWTPFDFSTARFGQFRREALLGGALSTWDLPMFERPMIYQLREDLTYSGRDLGADVEINLQPADFLELSGTAGVFNGNERAAERMDSELLYSFRGTADVEPIGLMLGGSAVVHRLGAADQSSVEGYSSSERLSAFSADLAFEHKFSNWYDLQLMGEFSTGDNHEWCDPIAGEDPPKFQGYWCALAFSWHPWRVETIRTLSVSAAFDRLEENTDLEGTVHDQITLAASVYPRENIRFRFGGIRHREEDPLAAAQEYTDIILEAGLRF